MDDLDLEGLRPLTGGWSGQTFSADLGGEQVVVRIYPPGAGRGDDAALIDAALLRLVRGLLPVADVLECRRADQAADRPGLLVTEWLPGVRGDLVLPDLDAAARERLGAHLGGLLADLAGMPMVRGGEFVDVDLTVRPHPPAADGLPAWVDEHRSLFGWSAAELRGLDDLAADAQALLDEVDRVCLVHSDFNPKNLLIDPETLTVTGLLDWEFAHAGLPVTDLGNLLRFDDLPGLGDAVVGAYVDRHGGRPDDVRALGRAADLWALVDLAARAGDNPVADRAAALLRERAGER